ncbi:PTS system transporter subunit IIBC [Klebsiella oxytoca]|nr:PTS system transporter subunit IIBC [Klebsiella oxytoca]
MDYNQVANAIVGHCGGLANFLHVTNCMTRVRMTISDQTRVNIAALKSIEGVLGVVEDDTLQVIVGPGKSSKVANVINDLLKGQPADATPLSNVEQKAQLAREKAKKQTRTKVILKHIANIFVPILPSLIAAGILMGINNVLVNSAASWGAGASCGGAGRPVAYPGGARSTAYARHQPVP